MINMNHQIFYILTKHCRQRNIPKWILVRMHLISFRLNLGINSSNYHHNHHHHLPQLNKVLSPNLSPLDYVSLCDVLPVKSNISSFYLLLILFLLRSLFLGNHSIIFFTSFYTPFKLCALKLLFLWYNTFHSILH